LPTAIYDTQTNRWMPSGGDGSSRYRRITVPRNPDDMREAYSGDDTNPIRSATSQERATWAASVPRSIDTSILIDAFTGDEWQALQAAAATNKELAHDIARWIARKTTNVTDPEFQTLMAQFAPIAWPDPTVRAARLADFTALINQ
jgi:hypothetical protein